MKNFKLIMLTLMMTIILPIVVSASERYSFENYLELNTESNNDISEESSNVRYIEEKIKDLNFTFVLFADEGMTQDDFYDKYAKIEEGNFDTKRIVESVKKLINDDSIEVIAKFDGIIDAPIYYKLSFGMNGVIYVKNIDAVEIPGIRITIPQSIPNTEEANKKYALEALKKYHTIGVVNDLVESATKVGEGTYSNISEGKMYNPVHTTADTNFPILLVREEKNIPITSVKLNKKSLSLVKGKTEKVNATINPTDTTDSKTLTWISSNTKVATVDQNGNIKAIAAGTANITVKTSNGKTATVKVTVTNPYTPITGVRINQKKLTVVTGKTGKLTATINPSNTTQSKALTWSSSNKKIATVDKNGAVKGIKKGTATITVKTSNGKTATIKVTVINPVKIKSVKLNKKTLKLELNKSATVKATINPSNTTDSKTLTWSTSNKKVATVDKNGKITAKGAGKATITVKTSNGKKATVKVTVLKINAKKATITAIKNQAQNGKALKPAVEVKLNGKVLKNGTDYTVTYKNNKKPGKATVTVKFKGNYTGSKTGSFIIVPSKANITSLTASKDSITVKYSSVSGAKTYQIAYRIKGTNKWNYVTNKTTSKKISKLTTGKEYEVMIRAGIKSGSKTLYGAWSNKKYVSIKKIVNDSTKEAEARKIAKKIAEVANANGSTKLEKIQNAAYLVAQYAYYAEYTNEDKDYRTAYGVFVKGVYTCAGTARALGMVLEEMGYDWKHVNANKYTHQWVELTVDGKKVWADAFPTLLLGGKEEMAGYGNYPYA